MEGLTGMIKMYAVAQSPVDWALCDGSLLKVAEFPQLFAKIGDRYGGDGNSTFALPQLAGQQNGFFLIRVRHSPEEEAALKGTLSQIILYAGDGLPPGWVDCDGRKLSHADYPALSQLMGTNHADAEGFLLPTIPEVNGVRYLICVEGINPTGGEEEDDDDY